MNPVRKLTRSRLVSYPRADCWNQSADEMNVAHLPTTIHSVKRVRYFSSARTVTIIQATALPSIRSHFSQWRIQSVIKYKHVLGPKSPPATFPAKMRSFLPWLRANCIRRAQIIKTLTYWVGRWSTSPLIVLCLLSPSDPEQGVHQQSPPSSCAGAWTSCSAWLVNIVKLGGQVPSGIRNVIAS